VKTLEAPEIQLSPEETAGLKAIIAEDTKVGEEQIHLIFVCSPEFLKEGVRLCKFRVERSSGNNDIRFAFVFQAGEQTEVCTFWGPLLIRGNRFQKCCKERSPLLPIDEANALEYARFNMGIANEWTLIEDLDDVSWTTPLLDEEKQILAAALETNRLQCLAKTDQSLEIAACILQGDKLIRAIFFVDRVTLIHSFGFRKDDDKDALIEGRLHCDNDRMEVLLSGLPDNYIVGPQNWASDIQEASKDKPYDWMDIPDYSEQANIIQDINRHLTPILPINGDCTLRRKYLPFYDQFLYEITTPFVKGKQRAFVIWSPGKAEILGCDDKSILELNKKYSVVLYERLGSKENVKEYLHFFSWYWWDKNGPTYVVESTDHPKLQRLDLSVRTVPDTLPEGEVLSYIKPARIDEEGDSYNVEFYSLEGYSVFHIKLNIKRNGDWNIVEGKDLVTFSKPDGDSLFPCELLGMSRNAIDPLDGGQPGPGVTVCSAESLVDEINSITTTDNGIISDRIVIGSIDLDGVNVTARLIFKNCRFRGPVNMSSLSCSSSLTIESCLFEHGLTMEYANINQALMIADTTFISDVKGKDVEYSWSLILGGLNAQTLKLSKVDCQGGMHAKSVRITGDLDISEFVAHDPVTFEDSVIDGYFGLSSGKSAAFIRSWLNLNHLNANRVHIEGLCVDEQFFMRHAVIDQYVYFGAGSNLLKSGPVTIGRKTSKDPKWLDDPTDNPAIDLYCLTINFAYLYFQAIKVFGGLDARFVKVGTGIVIDSESDDRAQNVIYGSLLLQGSSSPKMLRIKGCEIGGDIDASNIIAGNLTVSEAHTIQKNNDTEELKVLPMTIGGHIDFSGSKVLYDMLLAGVETNINDSDAPYSLELRGIEVKGNLHFYKCVEQLRREDPKLKDLITRPLVSKHRRGVNLRKAVINGDLNLYCMDASSGEIDLSDAVVDRDVHCSQCEGGFPVVARKLSLEGIRCGGSIDLSGLMLKTPEADNDPRHDIADQGSVIGSGACINGSLLVYKEGATANIPGKLDLGSSTLGKFAISYRHFNKGEESCNNEELEKAGIILNKARIDKLSVMISGDEKNGYPCPVDLRFAEIKWWEFEDENGLPRDTAGDYIELLSRDVNKQRDTWRAVEDSLYEHGHEDEADSVHRAMRKWVRDSNKQGKWKSSNQDWQKSGYSLTGKLRARITWLFGRLFNIFFRAPVDWLTEYGTSVHRLAFVIIVWFAFSTWVFSISGNIAPSEEGLAITNTEITSDDHPSEWGLIDGFWMAARFHVPIVLFTARDEWEPTNSTDMIVSENARWTDVRVSGKKILNTAEPGTISIPHINPEGYANFVMALHWVAWPIILITVSRKLFRRSGAK